MGKEIDFYLPEYNIGIELNGVLWHSTFSNKDKWYHYNKKDLALKNNTILYTIWEDDWKNKTDIVKYTIKKWLNIYDSIIDIKDCTIKYVSPHDKNIFLKNNDINGISISSKDIGIYYNNMLIAVCSIKYSNNIIYIIKYTTYQTIYIENGLKRIIDFITQNFKPNKIITYINRDVDNEKEYILNEFNIINISLNYKWLYNGKRYSYKKQKK